MKAEKFYIIYESLIPFFSVYATINIQQPFTIKLEKWLKIQI